MTCLDFRSKGSVVSMFLYSKDTAVTKYELLEELAEIPETNILHLNEWSSSN